MNKFFLILFTIIQFGEIHAQETLHKQQVLILTDIENEPDDTQSLIRFLLYSNQWDILGIIATTSTHLRDRIAPQRIKEVIKEYGKVQQNLLKHEKGFPEMDKLLNIVKSGLPVYGMQGVGAGKDSEGSEWIIKMVDQSEKQPVWICSWGGTNCLAQALWKVSMSRSFDEIETFLSKIRIYTISDQDDSGPWIRTNFPNLFYIVSPGYYEKGAYHYATWCGISGDQRHSFSGPDFSIVDNPWLDKNIREGHGALGAKYPKTEFIMEGDTPSFLYLIPNGLNEPEHPDWGSWGGRYELYTPRYRKWFYQNETRPIWTDTEDEVTGNDGNTYISNKATVWRWRTAYQNDFAARMDWTIKSYKEANHQPIVILNHLNNIKAKSGDVIHLNAEKSTDPDGDTLTYKWEHYREPGTFGTTRLPLEISDSNQQKAYFIAPKVFKPETIHIILSVTDNGVPPLTRYQRVIITVYP
ncbi:DUF1593 domain-containing protein [Flavobacterium ajazii]|uniref:DUF1593 domain-containing protein n=1 Tax=Flavobacterium ajazii TaxID=2692318 RepID=UPI0013CF5497|nr:DUF1593 domain-containing protein [Flavobacterium ajazii]